MDTTDFLITATQVQSELMRQVRKDLKSFFGGTECEKEYNQRGIYTCEADMQVRLAQFLRSSTHYSDVIVEYKIPQIIYKQRLRKANLNIPSPIYPWENDMRIDIVVKGKEKPAFVLIELKYITSELKGNELFGEEIEETSILKNHDATNLLRYNYWRDVRRIEMLTGIFKNIIGGYAVLVSNNNTLLKTPSKDALYKNFSTEDDRMISNVKGPNLLDWEEINGKKMKKEICRSYPEFILEGKYECKWEDSCMGNPEKLNGHFKYMILPIEIKRVFYHSTPNKFAVGQNTTSQELIDWFRERFNLVLKIYRNNKKNRLVETPKTILTQIGAKKGIIPFRTSMTVGTLIKHFAEKLKLHVNIFTKDGNVKVLDGISLASARQIPAGATRKSMEPYISYKRTKSESRKD